MSFYHTIEFAPGEFTPGWPVVVPIVDMVRSAMRRETFTAKRVLDIGCRDGALSFEAERLGAAEVIGIDFDLPEDNIRFLSERLSSKAQFRRMNLFDLTPGAFGRFDIVILSGVLYHLRYPFSALRLLRDIVADGGKLIVETATLVDEGRMPLMYCPVGADSPYDPSSCTFFNVRGLTDTLKSFGFSVEHRQSLTFNDQNAMADAVRRASDPVIDRTVVVCRRDAVGPGEGDLPYWDGSHVRRAAWDDGGGPSGRR
jgi:SAM-dependent methyltransferase